jgi:hypothetical protein
MGYMADTPHNGWRTPIDLTEGDDDSEELVVSLRALPERSAVQVSFGPALHDLNLAQVEALIDDLTEALKEAQAR